MVQTNKLSIFFMALFLNLTFKTQLQLSVFLLFFLVNLNKTQAQLEVQNQPVQDLVQNVLLGQGVTATNITFTGNVSQFGTFNGVNSNIGLNNGVLMTTGGLTVALGPNNQGGASVPTGGSTNGDPDLALVASTTPDRIRDVAIIEFDFVPIGDTISFRYVFASEEYPNFVCSNFNDAFAFFLSGPGISGPYSLNSTNIALIPGTTTPVAINTINSGQPGFSGSPGGCPPGGLNNSQYFINNNNGQTVQFNGFTTPLTAKATVQCDQTYHIKIAISDVFDGQYDSGVFLEAESFKSAGVQIDIAGVLPDSSVIEGCTTAEFVFNRPTADDSLIIYLNIIGTASNGIDYEFIPDSIIFLPGQNTITLLVNPLADQVIELERESIIIEVFNITACGDTIIETATIYIKEDYDILLTSSDVNLTCPQESVQISTNASGGVEPYTYVWSSIQTGNSIQVSGLESGTYIVTVNDFCNLFTVQDTVAVNVNAPPPLQLVLSNDTVVNCPGDFVTLKATAQDGTPGYNYLWSNGSTNQIINPSINENTFFTVTLTDFCQFPVIIDTVYVNLINGPLGVLSLDTNVTCPGDSITLTGLGTGGFPPLIYTWDNNEVNESISIIVDSTISISYTFRDGCESSLIGTVNIQVPVYEPLIVLLDQDTITICKNSPISLEGTIEGGSGVYFYTWLGAGNITVFEDTLMTVTPPSSGEYFFIASDLCGNTDTISAKVTVENCEITIYNVFSPNGDGINDIWVIPNIEGYINNEVIIYNRWGQKVFEASPYLNNWDGGSLPSGVYFYVVNLNDNSEKKAGTVTIIRN
jgi:gliding motility-associated-like protein